MARASPHLRLKLQRHAVHAVALAGGPRTVGKHMPQVPAAARTMHFGARHAETAIGGGAHCFGQRGEKTWPARTAVELGR